MVQILSTKQLRVNVLLQFLNISIVGLIESQSKCCQVDSIVSMARLYILLRFVVVFKFDFVRKQ